MSHPRRPGPFQDGGLLGWTVWAIFSFISPDEPTAPGNASLVGVLPTTSPVTNLATNFTTPVAENYTSLPHNYTSLPTSFPTSLPCVPVGSPFAPFWDILNNILASVIVSWLIPLLISFSVDVLFAFLQPATPPTPPPNEHTNEELQDAKDRLERADQELASVKQELVGVQSFAEDQRTRAKERGSALAASDKRAQALSKKARLAKKRFRENVAGHNSRAKALTREQERSGRLERAASTHQGQAGKWREKAEEADAKIQELQSKLDVAEMQPSEVPDTFRPSTILKDQLAEAVAARDSAVGKLAAAEEQAKQVQQSQADLQGQLDKAVAAKVYTETKANALNQRVAELATTEQQSANSLAREKERSASLESDKHAAKASAQSLQERVDELEKSASRGEEARADVEAQLTSSQQKLADAEGTATSVKAQLEEANAVKATSESQLMLAEKQKSALAAGKEEAEREKDAALRRAEDGDQELQAARQELEEAKGKIAELTAYKQQQEDAQAEAAAFLNSGGQAQGNVPSNDVGGSYDPLALPADFQANEDDGVFGLADPFAFNDDPLPADFLADFGGVGDDAAAGPSEGQGEFNFAEPPEPAQAPQAGPSFPSSSFSFTPPSTVPTSTVPQPEVQPQQGGRSFPSFSFNFTPPSTVPTSTVPQQQGQPPQGGPIFGGVNFPSAPSSTPFVPDLSFFSTDAHPSTVFTGQTQPQAAGPSDDYNREITEADFAEGFAEWEREFGPGKDTNPPENETKEESSSESEEE